MTGATDESGLIFDFIVTGQPRTGKSKSMQSWKDKVAEAARGDWPNERPLFATEAAVVIIFFFNQATNLDIDNIVKPILDALVGTVIVDDGLVSQVIARKTDQAAVDDILNPPTKLTNFLRKHPQFVYVAVKGPPDHRRLPDERN